MYYLRLLSRNLHSIPLIWNLYIARELDIVGWQPIDSIITCGQHSVPVPYRVQFQSVEHLVSEEKKTGRSMNSQTLERKQTRCLWLK